MSSSASTPRPRVAMLIPAVRRAEVLTTAAIERLQQIADVVDVASDSAAIAERLTELLADADACLTGWGTPPISNEVLDRALRLRLIAHTAGSVKRLIPASVFERNVAVSHAADVIADAVAEITILYILLGLRRVHEMDRALKNGVPWREAAAGIAPRQLAALAVGIVGAGYVGRKVARLVAAFGPRVRVYDPYLRAETAASLGVEAVPLDVLFRESNVVSIHAPITPETHHLVGERQLQLLRDGAVFVNCARSWVVDQDALLSALQAGRFWAALDVFDQEPLPIDSPFRQLANVVITPHQAGHTLDTYQRQGMAMVEEIERFFAGHELKHRISAEAFRIMA